MSAFSASGVSNVSAGFNSANLPSVENTSALSHYSAENAFEQEFNVETQSFESMNDDELHDSSDEDELVGTEEYLAPEMLKS